MPEREQPTNPIEYIKAAAKEASLRLQGGMAKDDARWILDANNMLALITSHLQMPGSSLSKAESFRIQGWHSKLLAELEAMQADIKAGQKLSAQRRQEFISSLELSE